MYQVLRDIIRDLHVTVVEKIISDFHPIYSYFRSEYGYYPMVSREKTGRTSDRRRWI